MDQLSSSVAAVLPVPSTGLEVLAALVCCAGAFAAAAAAAALILLLAGLVGASGCCSLMLRSCRLLLKCWSSAPACCYGAKGKRTRGTSCLT